MGIITIHFFRRGPRPQSQLTAWHHRQRWWPTRGGEEATVLHLEMQSPLHPRAKSSFAQALAHRRVPHSSAISEESCLGLP